MKQEMTILLVEDQNDIGQMIRDFLSDAGYAVVQKSSLKSALEYCDTHQPAGVLLDMIVDDGMGSEMFVYLRDKRIPVCITSILSREKVHRILGIKEFNYLQKPFDLKEFLETVRLVFDNPI